MSLLTPLYVLGALAVGLPLLFHLIQRRPKGQMEYSSLMFLSPSPPRISRRSRLDNLLLLLLRGLALVLLALAFGRPFLRSSHWMDEEPPGRRILVLVDTSASMRRGELWEHAKAAVQEIASDLRATDDAALFAFDSSVRPLVSFGGGEERREIELGEQFSTALSRVSPSYSATDLGTALTAAADVLHTSRDESETSSSIPKQIVVVTDLQQGSDIENLRGYAWPEEIRVDIRLMKPPKPTNARALVVSDDAPLQNDDAAKDGRLRVTVVSAGDSVNQQFRLGWADGGGRLVGGREFSVQVPPGGSRTLRMPKPPPAADGLVLTGDDQPFDNVVFVARPTPQAKEVLFIGDDSADVQDSLLYYLARVDLSDTRSTFTVASAPDAGLPPDLSPRLTPLVVVAKPIEESEASTLSEYVEKGGKVLLVLSSGLRDAIAAEATMRQLVSDDSLSVSEAIIEEGEYAMLAEVDFTHPIFQPFVDPRFNDFTKIRFWSHRALQTDEGSPARVLAKFEDRSEALLEYVLGDGRLWILAAGWQPSESQLALSSKFIPVLGGMLRADQRTAVRESSWIGEPIELPPDHPFENLIMPDGQVLRVSSLTASRPVAALDDGMRVTASAQGERTFVAFHAPGVYRLHNEKDEIPLAVNLPASESRTMPLDVSELEANGVELGEAATVAELRSERRRLRDTELERGQKLWQWLLVGVLVVLAAESWLAGRLSKRPLAVAPT